MHSAHSMRETRYIPLFAIFKYYHWTCCLLHLLRLTSSVNVPSSNHATIMTSHYTSHNTTRVDERTTSHNKTLNLTSSGNERVSRDTPIDGSKKLNVLMIIADDLRPELGVFYDAHHPYSMYPRIQTPNLNYLGAQSLVLRRAYVQQAICAPSRLSFLTSRRPDTTQIYTINDVYWRQMSQEDVKQASSNSNSLDFTITDGNFKIVSPGNFTTIPEFFKNNGYRSIGIGKIFHHGHGSDYDDPPSWSPGDYHRVLKSTRDKWHGRSHSWRAVTPNERVETPLPDDLGAEKAIELLRNMNASDSRPFFMSVGFYKPHLPFVFPSQYLNLYPETSIEIPKEVIPDTRMPDIAWMNWELNKYSDIQAIKRHGNNGSDNHLPLNISLALRRAYYASVSYVDDLVGRIISELKSQNLFDNTIVTFMGDHGWHLGEKNMWGKHTNFELATRAPLMIKIPGVTDARGVAIFYDKPVEFVDLFPTLVEAAGFSPLSVCPEYSRRVALCTEGKSLLNLISPKHQLTKDTFSLSQSQSSLNRQHRTIAYSQYPRRGFSIMGYSVRTERFRYTEWIRWKNLRNSEAKNRYVYAIELYDHTVDPDEARNLAGDDAYSGDQLALSHILPGAWRRGDYQNATKQGIKIIKQTSSKKLG